MYRNHSIQPSKVIDATDIKELVNTNTTIILHKYLTNQSYRNPLTQLTYQMNRKLLNTKTI